jgi:hypothetical protein
MSAERKSKYEIRRVFDAVVLQTSHTFHPEMGVQLQQIIPTRVGRGQEIIRLIVRWRNIGSSRPDRHS